MDKVRRYVRSRVIRMSRSESIRRSGYFSRCTPIHGTNHHECHLLQTQKQAVCWTLNLLRNMFNKWSSPQQKNQNRIITKLTVAHSSDNSNTMNTNPDHTDVSVPLWDQFKNHIALAHTYSHTAISTSSYCGISDMQSAASVTQNQFSKIYTRAAFTFIFDVLSRPVWSSPLRHPLHRTR